MISALFSRKPSLHDQVFAEAQALVDDGLDVDFVLGLYPEDAIWLEPLLRTSETIIDATGAEEPSFYFEANLKARFIAAGMERAAAVPEPVAPTPQPWFRGALAGVAVVALSGVASVLTLGFVTAGQAVPGDWNYAFKITGERIEYALATGDDRVSVELAHKQERVNEFQQRMVRGDITQADVQRLRQELEEVAEIERQASLDPVQKASVKAIGESTTEILTTVKVNKPELAPAVDDAIFVAAGIGTGVAVSTVEPIDPADEVPTATTATAGGEQTPSPVASATGTPTETPTPTATPTPTETPTPTATPSPTPSETPTGTPSPGPSATPTGSTTPGDAPSVTPAIEGDAPIG